MSVERVLIAAFSGRALAQSARRSGYEPLVADCFGDEDMREAAAASRCVPILTGRGFLLKPMLAALEELAPETSAPPLGLVLGSGLEGTPNLVHRLAERFRLLSNGPEVIERTKDPESFFGALQRLGIPHPETRTAPPADTTGWLMKRVGGSGGGHVVDCPARPVASRRHYFQRKVPGDAISLLGILGPASTAFAFSRQWTAPSPTQPFRYGGAVGSVLVEPDIEGRLIDAALAVAREFNLAGLVSFDFLVSGADTLLIEVNPRPGATLDIFDDASGTLFAAHVEAFKPGGDPADLLAKQWRPPIACAVAYLYADHGAIETAHLIWPEWVRDRPRAGTRIAKRQPLATVIAEGESTDQAEMRCRERLRILEDMLYGRAAGKETQ